MVYLPAAHLRQDFPSLLHSSQSPTSQSRHLRPVLPEPSLAMGQDATHDCLSRARYLESPHVTHAPVVGAQATQFVVMDEHVLHGEASLVLENVPDVHEVQVAAADVEPGVKPLPVEHEDIVCALQAAVSVVEENVPEVHDEHAASSAVVEPGEKPWPAGHEETVFALHAVASLVLEKVPDAQEVQVADVVEEPAVNPWPVGHDVVDCV